MSVCGMCVINAQIDKLLLHFVDDLPACRFVLLLEILGVTSYKKDAYALDFVRDVITYEICLC